MAPRNQHRVWRAIALATVLALVACGGEERREPVRTAAARQRSPIADSIRARRNAAMRARPDTLGMRADSGRIAGAAAAPVWIIVMSDFQCAACREFAAAVLPALRRDYVDKSLARLAFVNAPQERHFNARFAAQAALCASAQGRFWPMHDALFIQQHTWERMPDPRPFMNDLAVSVGVAATFQEECMGRDRMLHQLSLDIERALNANVTEVPTVFVGEQRFAGRDVTLRHLEEALRAALSK
jgi:2-hydroxychromene-2-carboxylate isomerase